MPLAAYGGREDLMALVAPAGPVYQAGTYAAHPLAIAAALASLDALDADPGLYERIERTGETLERGLAEAARRAGVALQVQRVGSMWTPFFGDLPVRSWDDAASVDPKRYAAFFRGMLARGVLLPPSQFECSFLSAAHGEAEIAHTLESAAAALAEVPA
jgi:glutamate-1-semialdehyde 2,1-aminomutase